MEKPKQIVVAVPELSSHDAVSRDAVCQFEWLRLANYNVFLYAENWLNPSIQGRISKNELLKIGVSKDAILLYRHAVFWQQGQEILETWGGKVLLRYHSVTPPRFFKGYDFF